MSQFPLPSMAVLTDVAKGMRSNSQRRERMRLNEIRAEGEYRLATQYAQNEDAIAGRAAAYDFKSSQKAADRDEARYMMDRQETFAVEEQNRAQAHDLQLAGMKLRGRTSTRDMQTQPTQGVYQPQASPNQQAIMTGPAGMLTSRGGGPVERVTGVNEQMAAAEAHGQNVQFNMTDTGFDAQIYGKTGFARAGATPQPAPNAFAQVIAESAMDPQSQQELSRLIPYVGQKNGMTVNQFLNSVEEREPQGKSAGFYHDKIARLTASYQKMRMEGHSENDLSQIRAAIAFYNDKLRAAPGPAWNPMQGSSILGTPEPADRVYTDAELDAMLDAQ